MGCSSQHGGDKSNDSGDRFFRPKQQKRQPGVTPKTSVGQILAMILKPEIDHFELLS